MTIGWVDEKMVMWGDWARRRDDGGLGYPKDSPTFRMRSTYSSPGSMVLVESDALQIEAAMNEVKKRRPELYAVGYSWYFVGDNVSKIVSRIGCHRDTVYARLDSLHIVVANLISERTLA